MTLSPYSAYSHLNESLAGYLDTAYKLAHPDLVAERRELLADVGRISQLPLIESTPDYPAGRFLSDVVAAHPETFPHGLSDLMGCSYFRFSETYCARPSHGRKSRGRLYPAAGSARQTLGSTRDVMKHDRPPLER